MSPVFTCATRSTRLVPRRQGERLLAPTTITAVPASQTRTDGMPTGKSIRVKNERNARNVREGKTKPRPAYAERVSKRAPVGNIALGLICFVVIGGVFVELLRLFF